MPHKHKPESEAVDLPAKAFGIPGMREAGFFVAGALPAPGGRFSIIAPGRPETHESRAAIWTTSPALGQRTRLPKGRLCQGVAVCAATNCNMRTRCGTGIVPATLFSTFNRVKTMINRVLTTAGSGRFRIAAQTPAACPSEMRLDFSPSFN